MLSGFFPSKTFLIGEYSVLNRGPGILVNTTPRFNFSVFSNSKTEFPAESPAGQWLKLHPQISRNYKGIIIQNPHEEQGEGGGGFGFSSAQFNLVYALNQKLKKKDGEVKKLWQAYQSLRFKGITPSGADVCSQWLGGVCLFRSEPFLAKSISWPFKDLDFFLIRTGINFNTWEHLASLSNLDFLELKDLSEKALVCLENSNSEGFLSLINQYSLCMEKQGLIHKNTFEVLKRIRKIKQVIVARGCGALGAEVVALFFHPDNKQKVQTSLKEKPVASSADIIYG